jgi:hypothetical protein
MAPKKLGKITIENAQMMFRNFAGAENQYNRAGDRNFAVVIEDPEFAQELIADGWNVKIKEPREEGDEPFMYLGVSVSYKNQPPQVTMLTSAGRTRLNEQTIDVLDYTDIINVDVVLNPYEWSMPSGASGVKAYLKTMFVKVDEDDLEKKYADWGVDKLPEGE